MRYQILDGFRGFFLIFMLVAHANEVLQAILGKLNHHSFGWVEDAQGFVFISGLVVGLVYGGRLERFGAPAMVRAVVKRCREIYLYHAVVILLFLAAALTFAAHAPALRLYSTEPVVFTLASLGLVTASMDMGILPMYLYFMAVTPAVLLAFKRGAAPAVGALSVGFWMLAQTGLLRLAERSAEQGLMTMGLNLHLALYFNLFGWQVLYFFGLYLGYRLTRGELDLTFLKAAGYRWAFYVCVVIAFGLGIFDRIVFDQWIASPVIKAFESETLRKEFSALYLIAFAVDLYIAVWLLAVGVEASQPALRGLARFVRWIFTRRPLVFLGQHSLQVFAFHMVVVYAIHIAFETGPPGPLVGNGLLILGVISLYVPAWLHAKWQAMRAIKSSPGTPSPRVEG